MRQFFFPLMLAACLAFPISCQPSPVEPTAAHQIELVSRSADLECSATAVGQHTLLSAAHCMIGTSTILVDGSERHILVSLYDENDHVLLVLDGIAFPSTREIEQRDPVKGEHVRICGWPGESKTAVCRDGFFKTIEKDSDLLVWQLPVYGGDSGSGLIADDGKVINVVSLGNGSAETKNWRLAFSANQLQDIK